MVTNDQIDTEDILRARKTAAQLAIRYADQYPDFEKLFDRLDRELQMRQTTVTKADRLREIAAGD